MVKQTTMTMTELAAAWVRLGVMLNVEATIETPDVERVLLNTARLASENVRLFTLAGTWLRAYGDYVAGHRLAVLIRRELEEQHRPTMGLLLEWSDVAALRRAVVACGKARDARPLSDVEARSQTLFKFAESRATDLSRKWGRWSSASLFEIRLDALRGTEWVAAHNRTLATRALVGNVAASILAEWPVGSTIESEAEIARRIGASRLAVSAALRKLQLGGLVRLSEDGRRNEVAVLGNSSALATASNILGGLSSQPVLDR